MPAFLSLIIAIATPSAFNRDIYPSYLNSRLSFVSLLISLCAVYPGLSIERVAIAIESSYSTEARKNASPGQFSVIVRHKRIVSTFLLGHDESLNQYDMVEKKWGG